jgi:undecaprenyl diphosphate synthase
MQSTKVKLTAKDQSNADEVLQTRLKKRGEMPSHIAIIMDGNGRWAKKQGWQRVFGHREGIESVRDITEACAQLGVKYLTLYTFSTENWNRPKTEVTALMELLVNTIRKEVPVLDRNQIRVNTIGDMQALPTHCRREMEEAMQITAQNSRMMLTLALSYSGRSELVQATQQIAQKIKSGELQPEDITADVINQHLYTANMPDPELLIRTGGELRISNYLLWQVAYTEFYITETFWPEFRRQGLYQAIEAYQDRDRRFGGVKEA